MENPNSNLCSSSDGMFAPGNPDVDRLTSHQEGLSLIVVDIWDELSIYIYGNKQN